MAEYCAWPTASFDASFMERAWIADSEPGPRNWMSPMWLTSNKPHSGADRHVLGGNAGVFDRHIPAAKVDHFGAELPVDTIQCSLAQGPGATGEQTRCNPWEK